MNNTKIMQRCFTCEKQFQMGPGIYDGKFVSRYKMSVCLGCFNANRDGWTPLYEEAIIQHLVGSGLPIPERNSKNLLPQE